jgi:hypothetical protein
MLKGTLELKDLYVVEADFDSVRLDLTIKESSELNEIPLFAFWLCL